MYVGLHMLSRVQAEAKENAIKQISLKSKFLRHLIKKERTGLENIGTTQGECIEMIKMFGVYVHL